VIVHKGPQPGLARAKPRLNPSEIGIAELRDDSAPTGETAALSSFGGWKPITLISSRSHSGRSLSGSPPFDPFRSLKKATRFIISWRVQGRSSGIIVMSPRNAACGSWLQSGSAFAVRRENGHRHQWSRLCARMGSVRYAVAQNLREIHSRAN
jgi:hypothetical protein